LTEEFARQRLLEKEFHVPTSLPFGDDMNPETALATGQTSFIEYFALPLFRAVSSLVPNMQWTVHALERNQRLWDGKLQEYRQNGTEANATSQAKITQGKTSERTLHAMASKPELKGSMKARLPFFRHRWTKGDASGA